MPGISDLFDACAEWLDVCKEGAAMAPGGEIERAFVCAGPPAFDVVPQLTVHPSGPRIADTSPLQPPLQPAMRIHNTGLLYLVLMTCTVIRHSPVLLEEEGEVPMVPAAEALQQVAEETCGDLWAIWNHTLHSVRQGDIFNSPSGRREFTLDQAVPLNTSGGVAGWQITAVVQLGGYTET